MPTAGLTDMQAHERAYASSPWSPSPEPTPVAVIRATNDESVASKDSPFKITGGNSLSAAETLRRLGGVLDTVVKAQGNVVEKTSPDALVAPAPPPPPRANTMLWLGIAALVVLGVIYLSKD